MARPKKCRRICKKPVYESFVPKVSGSKKEVVLSFEEFEAIRLIDFEKKTQEQCAKQMNIARTTVTDMYEQARFKVADCLVNGKELRITGGNYVLCDGFAEVCYERKCYRRNCKGLNLQIAGKGDNQMRVAVTYENGTVFQHFGHAENFKIYDIENKKIINMQVVPTNGSGHGALAGFLQEHKVDILICGGIGGGAKMALAEAGIQLYGGVSGTADEAVNALIAGNLGYNPEVHCEHHDHEHGEEGHQCGTHGCGNGSCH